MPMPPRIRDAVTGFKLDTRPVPQTLVRHQELFFFLRLDERMSGEAICMSQEALVQDLCADFAVQPQASDM